MRKRLTKLTLEQRLPKAGRLEVRDFESPLVYRLTSSGTRSFSVRTRLNGQQLRFTYPAVARVENLEDARGWAHRIVDKCKAGLDPREEQWRVQKVSESDALRFWVVLETFIARHAKRNKTWRDTQAIFALHVLPYWGNRLITEISRSDVARLLDIVEDRTSVYRTNRVLAAVRKLFNWAVARGTIEKSPVVPGMARQGEKSRDRYLTPREIRLVWKSAQKLGYPAGTLIQLLLLTGQRRSEVAGMRWDQLDLEREKVWTLPPEQTKAGREHCVPLSDPAIHLIQSAPQLGEYVLSTGGATPISGFSKWKKRLDEEVAAFLRGEAAADSPTIPPLPSWRLHDLRRTVATHMEELGIPPHMVGSVLNHDPKGYKGVTSVYTRGNLLYERRKALTAWARFLAYVLDRTSVGRLERILRPETEAEAARSDQFRTAIQSGDDGWVRFLGAGKRPAQSGHA